MRFTNPQRSKNQKQQSQRMQITTRSQKEVQFRKKVKIARFKV